MVLFLTFNSTLNAFFFVGNAALKLQNSLLSVALLLLNVLHQVVEDVLGLELFLFGFTLTILLDVSHLSLVPERGLEIGGLQLTGNKVFLHTLKHVVIGARVQPLSVNLILSLLQALSELGQSLLVVGDGPLDVGLLDLKTHDLLADAVVLSLLESDGLLGLVVLFLNLRELARHIVDLLLLVLGCSSVVRRLKQRIHLLELRRTIINLILLLHDGTTSARESRHTLGAALSSITVHLT